MNTNAKENKANNDNDNDERVYRKVRVLKTNWDRLRRAIVIVQGNGEPGFTLGDAVDQAIEIFVERVEAKYGTLPEEDVTLRRGRRVSL